MCGIGGFMRLGTTAIDPRRIEVLLCYLEHRGNHATGIALQHEDGSIAIAKAPEPAWQFVTSDLYEEFMTKYFSSKTRTVLLHTRFATIGNPMDNKNNHPMYLGKSAIVHNGHVNNHSHFFNTKKWERSAETDSDVIRAFVDEFGITKECIREMNSLSGGIATAAVHPDYPGKVLLARSGNPLVLGWHADEKMLIWGSEKAFLINATKPLVEGIGRVWMGNKSEFLWSTVDNDTGYIFGLEGQEFHGKFQSSGHHSSVQYRCNENYDERMGNFQREFARNNTRMSPLILPAAGPSAVSAATRKVRHLVCKKEDCRKVLPIPEKYINTPLSDLYCIDCGTHLA